MWLLLFCFSLKAVTIGERRLLHPEFLMRFAINQFIAQVHALTFGQLETWATFHAKDITTHKPEILAVLKSKPVNRITTCKIPEENIDLQTPAFF